MGKRFVLRRRGFTMMELLVVMGIILAVAGLTVAFLPRINEQQRVATAGSQLQGWLLIAKQKALRDRAPRGVRLLPGTGLDVKHITKCQYIGQPDDFVGGMVKTSKPLDTFVTVSGVDLSGGFVNDMTLWPVQGGDYLEINGGGYMYRIISVSPNGVQVSTPITHQISPTSHYRIVRGPRPVGGEVLELAGGVVIDTNTNDSFGNPLPFRGDILFAPNGTVIGGGTSTDIIQLWVRDANLAVMEGDNTLISVFTRSGALASSPVAPLPDPYLFAKNAIGQLTRIFTAENAENAEEEKEMRDDIETSSLCETSY